MDIYHDVKFFTFFKVEQPMNLYRSVVLTLFVVIVTLASINNAFALDVCASAYIYSNTYKDLGYVITEKLSPSSQCSSGVFKITIPPTENWEQTHTCVVSGGIDPAGFVVLSKGNNSYQCRKKPISTSDPYGNYEVIAYPGYPGKGYYTKFICGAPKSLLPTGWFVKRKDGGSCSDHDNYWTITLATEWYHTACVDVIGNLPEGYDVVPGSTQSSGPCGGSSLTISMDRKTGAILCDHAAFEIPDGYVITERLSVTGCGGYGREGAGNRITKIEHLTGQAICSVYGEDVPDGYVVTERDGYDHCKAGTGDGPGFKIAIIESGMTSMCALQDPEKDMPYGLLVTSITSSDNCGGLPRWGISYTLSSGPVYCEPSRIPEGFGYSHSSSYDQCNGGLGFKLIAIQTGSNVCQGSTNPEDFVLTIPEDFVITGVVKNEANRCNAGVAYELTQVIGSAEYNVCYPSLIPDGFIKIKVNASPTKCSGNSGFTIKRPDSTGETFICGDSPIPSPFAVTREVNTSNCGSAGFGYWISLITGPGPYVLCEGAEVPDGYVVTERNDNSSICNDGSITIKQPNIFGETICRGSPTPTGFVVVELTSSPACGSPSNAYRIRHPNQYGITEMCIVSGVEIPDGYGAIRPGTSTQCSPNASKQIAQLSGMLPTIYIGVEPDVQKTDVPTVTYDCNGGVSTLATTASRNPQCQ